MFNTCHCEFSWDNLLQRKLWDQIFGLPMLAQLFKEPGHWGGGWKKEGG